MTVTGLFISELLKDDYKTYLNALEAGLASWTTWVLNDMVCNNLAQDSACRKCSVGVREDRKGSGEGRGPAVPLGGCLLKGSQWEAGDRASDESTGLPVRRPRVLSSFFLFSGLSCFL